MTKDPDLLLKGVQRIARERDPAADPRWDALTAGSLSEEELAKLQREAEGSAAMGEAYQVFRPFEPEAHDRMISRVLSEIGPRPRAARDARRSGRVLVALFAAVALAATLLLVIGRLGSGEGGPLSSYELALAGGEKDSRSEPLNTAAILRLSDPETRIEVTLRPGTEQRGPVAARGVMAQDNVVRPWDPPITVVPGGTIVVAGTKNELFPGAPDGEWELIFAVGRPGALPVDAVLIEASRSRPEGPSIHRDFQVLKGRVLLGNTKAPGR